MPAKSLRPVRLLVTLLWPARLLCPRILQARTLEWVAIPVSPIQGWKLSLLRLHWQVGSLVAPPGKPLASQKSWT